jgi:arsenite methyltransferase
MRYRTMLDLHALALLLWLNACSQIGYRHMNDPERDVWQQPKAVIEALHITPGMHVADLGAGGGYFTFRLAEAVGPDGKVYAVDTDEASLRFIEQEGPRQGGMPPQVELILATPNDSRLPAHDTDLIFMCDTYHHLPDRVAYMRSLARSLSAHGRIAILDFKEGSWVGALFGHATSNASIRREMEAAGYRLIEEFDFLAKQHFQVFASDT